MNELDKIRQLEKESRLLEPEDNTRADWQTQTNAYAESFFHKRNTRKAYEDSSDNGLGLLDSPIEEKPLDIDEVLKLVEKSIDSPGIDLTSSRHFGYIPGGGVISFCTWRLSGCSQ